MKLDKKDLLLYAVTDRHWLNGRRLVDVVRESLEGGVTFVQLREKTLDDEAFLAEARELKELCREYKVPFVINDNVDIAIAMDADGVHVGQSDMEAGDVRAKLGPDKIIGVSAQTVEQAILAQKRGADYLGVGAVFPTGSKDDAEDVSYDTLKAICEAVSIPVIAIGGIGEANVSKLAGSGIVGVAVISAIYAADDICDATRKLKTSTRSALNRMNTALTIAGSDSSGGAGIQADIKTMTANGVYAMSAITALTAQNTTGVTGIMEVTPEFLSLQLEAIFTDIYPDAIKTGMVSSSELIRTISAALKKYKAKNIVVDPVMVATSGAKLISDDAIEVLKEELLPLATVITPNIPEAEVLSGMTIKSEDDMIAAAKVIYDKYRCNVLLKGGHKIDDANDLLYRDGGYVWFVGKRIDNPNTHGTGCTLSSAITSGLAKGESLDDAVKHAKDYISGALAAMLDLGKGSGPLAHCYTLH
ncbi:MAG: bifunctional hydroxymethylpyrimidine kinase/phosphomethylpyrimidine kinase [Lachnospiraceae bacterium]|nr:bifunctional hydroxymethylpyrimidine kinase/phosphomethylpyrimidine kinase [Lachnospiraceae bacterium]